MSTNNELEKKIDSIEESTDSLSFSDVDHFSAEKERNGELENEYDFGSASSTSRQDSDEDSWETVSEEIRAEHLEDGKCSCNSCSMKSMSLSARLQNRSIHETEELPENISKVVTESGATIYVVGTAHFSEASQEDVKRAIQYLSPDVVMVELCASRVGVLKYDEATLLKAAQDISVAKLKVAINESGSVVSGVMQLLLLSMSAHITKQLGMAPGGEFRVAEKEARRIPGCRLVLGDRPIQATLGRAMASLSVFQKMKLGWHLLFSKDNITKEDVEKYKQKDMIAEMLAEMTGDFPELSKVFVEERDQYMAQMLVQCIDMVKNGLPTFIQLKKVNSGSEICDDEPHVEKETPELDDSSGTKTDGKTDEAQVITCHDYQPVIVGVVGIGHMNGIVDNIGRNFDMKELTFVPPASLANRAVKMTLKAAVIAALSWSVYSVWNWIKS